MSGPPADGIHFERRGRLGIAVLDQPRRLNALTWGMVLALSRQLVRWRDDDGVGAVLVRAEGERAFCAGGDIRAVYEMRQRGVDLSRFFHDEYRMNWRVHAFPKPYVALIHGITMGGGVGISAPADFRVASEGTLFAMPETGIGLFPDVGGSYHLSRLPGRLGLYLGLTGARLGPADCVAAGIATSYTPVNRLDALEAAIAEAAAAIDPRAAVAAALADFAEAPAAAAELGDRRADIDALFGAPGVDALLDALDGRGDAWARDLAAELRTKSPTSLKVTFEQLRRGTELDFAGALRQEYRMIVRFLAGHDFFEGVRALVIDKDRRPRWRPADLALVTEADVAAYFAPLPEGDLEFGWEDRAREA